MKKQNSVDWPESQSGLNVIFDGITYELGPPDVNFRSGPRSFKVHKKVLEKHSSVMKAKLSDVWQTSGDVLQLDEEYVIPEVVGELLTWMYHNHAGKYWKCSTENAYSLCVTADYLMISDLVTSCSDILRQNITPENFYDFFKLSNRLKLDSLRQACDDSIMKMSKDYFLSPEIVKGTVEDLKRLIERLLKEKNDSRLPDLILLSFQIWVNSIEDRLQEMKNLLKFVPPKRLSSDTLFRFMETELYSKLDESHRKQYFVHPYLSAESSSTDKLYCVSQINAEASYTVHCLDLSPGGKWSDFEPEHFSIVPVLGTSWREKVCLLGYRTSDGYRCIKVYSTETGEWDSPEPLDDMPIHSVVAMNDYIYLTNSNNQYFDGQSFSRYCLKTKQWEALQDPQTPRWNHLLVALDGFVYAMDSENPHWHKKPERYDFRTNQWEYIAMTNYAHQRPAATAHEQKIYLISEVGFEAYSPETDQWTRLPRPDVCIKPSLVSIAGRLWLLTDSAHKVRLVYEFDVIKKNWMRLPDLPERDYTDFAFAIKQ